MSDHAKEEIQEYIITPPNLLERLKALSGAEETLRYGVMMNMIDTTLADGVLDPQESKALELAQTELNIFNEQSQAIANKD